MVSLEFFVVDGLESSEPDVQGDECDGGAGRAALIQDFRGEVQPGRGRRYGAAGACKDGLVALAIRILVGTLDIRRQWHMADFFEGGVNIVVDMEPYGALAELAPRDDLGLVSAVEA